MGALHDTCGRIHHTVSHDGYTSESNDDVRAFMEEHPFYAWLAYKAKLNVLWTLAFCLGVMEFALERLFPYAESGAVLRLLHGTIAMTSSVFVLLAGAACAVRIFFWFLKKSDPWGIWLLGLVVVCIGVAAVYHDEDPWRNFEEFFIWPVALAMSVVLMIAIVYVLRVFVRKKDT